MRDSIEADRELPRKLDLVAHRLRAFPLAGAALSAIEPSSFSWLGGYTIDTHESRSSGCLRETLERYIPRECEPPRAFAGWLPLFYHSAMP